MLRNNKRRTLAYSSSINMVPFIDVMMVLLVIFMISTPISLQQIKIDLPEASTKSITNTKEDYWVVSVNKAGVRKVYDKHEKSIPFQEESIANMLNSIMAKNKNFIVYIQGDKDTRYDNVIQTMTFLKQNGVVNIHLVTEPS